MNILAFALNLVNYLILNNLSTMLFGSTDLIKTQTKQS